MTIENGGVLLAGLGTGLGGGITDTIDSISLPIIILGNITVTTNLLMLGTMVKRNSLDLTMVEKGSLRIIIEADSIRPLAMVEDMVEDTIDELV